MKTTPKTLMILLFVPAEVWAQQCSVDPLARYTLLGGSASDRRIHITADTSQATDTSAEFSGNIEVVFGEHFLFAPHLRFNRENATIYGDEGAIYGFREYALEAQTGEFNIDSRVGQFNDIRYFIATNSAGGIAESIHSNTLERVEHLENVTYTTCERKQPTWYLRAKNMDLNHKTGRGVAHNITIHVKDTPVMYLPYFGFPLDDRRQTGFLLPRVGGGGDTGIEATIPYYFNLAPNYDATLSFRPMSKRGLMMIGETRYLQKKHSGELKLEYVPYDFEEEEDRWAYNITHRSNPLPGWSTALHLQDVSDINYLDDFQSRIDLEQSYSYLENYAILAYNRPDWHFMARWQDFVLVNDDLSVYDEPYSRMPQFLWEGTHHNFEHNLELYWRGEAVRFDKDDDVTGERYDFDLGVSKEWSTPYAFLRPQASFRGTYYTLHDIEQARDFPVKDNNISRALPTFSLDTGLFFERNIHWGEQSYLQTLEPRLFYLYTPYHDQSDIPLFDTTEPHPSWDWLFLRNRFVGTDRIADANQLTTTISTRIIDEYSGQERFKLSLGQIMYFDDREVRLKGKEIQSDSRSELIVEAAYQIDRHWQLRGMTLWDSYDNKNERSIMDLRYNLDEDRLLNLAHYYDREEYEQLDFSGVWRLNPQWRSFFRYNYSLRHDRSLDALLGIEYNDCCWAFRLVGRNYRDEPLDENDSFSVMFEFVFKGLSNVGSHSSRALQDAIPGYRPLAEETK